MQVRPREQIMGFRAAAVSTAKSCSDHCLTLSGGEPETGGHLWTRLLGSLWGSSSACRRVPWFRELRRWWGLRARALSREVKATGCCSAGKGERRGVLL